MGSTDIERKAESMLRRGEEATAGLQAELHRTVSIWVAGWEQRVGSIQVRPAIDRYLQEGPFPTYIRAIASSDN